MECWRRDTDIMKILAFLIAVFCGSSAFAQYASPTYQNLTVLGNVVATSQAVPIYATKASAQSARIDASIKEISLSGYSTIGDGGGAHYLRATQAPSHPLYFQSADGAYWIINEPLVSPLMAGAVLSSSVDSSTAVMNAWAYFQTLVPAFNQSGSTLAGVTQPAFILPPGLIRADAAVLTTRGPRVTIRGSGPQSALSGAQIICNSGGCNLSDFFLVDVRGVQAGNIGIMLTDNLGQRDYSVIHNVGMQARDTAFSVTGQTVNQAFDDLSDIQILGNNVGVHINNNSGMHFVNLENNNNFVKNWDMQGGGGEIKLVNTRSLGGPNMGNMSIQGTTAAPAFENYYSQITVTQAGARTMPVAAITDNGSGLVRIQTSAINNITSISERGNLFLHGSAGVAAYAFFSFDANSPGTFSQIAAGSTNLLPTPVTWQGNATATANAIVAAINNGTTGYTAVEAGTDRIFLYAPEASGASANGTLLTFTTSGISLFNNNWVAVTTSGSNGYVGGIEQDVELSAGSNYTGIAEVSYVESPTTFDIEANNNGTATGTVWVPNRLTLYVNGLSASGTPFDGAIAPIGVGSQYVDINVPYTGQTAAGTLSIAGWDLVFDPRDSGAVRVSDQFFNGGNMNYTLFKGAYNVPFLGTRLKSETWIDNRLNSQYRSARIFHVGSGRGLGQINGADVPIGGTNTGFGWVEQRDASGSTSPGGSYVSVGAPCKSRAIVNGLSINNEFDVYEDHATITVCGIASRFDTTGWTVPALTSAGTISSGPNSISTAIGDVNGIQIKSASAGNAPSITAFGTDTDVTLPLRSQGANPVELDPGGTRGMRVFRTGSTDCNYLVAISTPTGSAPSLAPGGCDANGPLRLSGAGTGLVNLGNRIAATASSGAATANGERMTITSESLSTAAGADYVLTVTNSFSIAGGIINCSAANGTNTTEGLAINRIQPSAGSFLVHVRNTNASAALNGTLVLSCAIF